MRGALNDATVQQVAVGLTSLGPPTAFVFGGKQVLPNGAGIAYTYRVITPGGAVAYVYSLDPDGKIGGIWFKPAP